MDDIDDEEENLAGLYENGHWAWDDKIGGLVFISHQEPKPPAPAQAILDIQAGAMPFKDNVDLLEQDVKDLALFTAPLALQSPRIINLLHFPTTDRLLRALIVYCQYYLQVEEEMTARILELEKKVRTPASDEVESMYRENLNDLRALVAKEYCCVILELELSRIFKTDTFNSVEHTHKTRYLEEMNKLKREVLVGPCLKKYSKLKCISPLMDEAFCHRPIDFRMMGVGVVKYDELDARQHYFIMALACPEAELMDHNVTVGILGLPRSYFDTMLNVIPTVAMDDDKTKSRLFGSAKSIKSIRSKKSTNTSKSSGASSTRSGAMKQRTRVYNDILLPPKPRTELPFPSEFPETPMPVPKVYDEQRKRWLQRYERLTKK